MGIYDFDVDTENRESVAIALSQHESYDGRYANELTDGLNEKEKEKLWEFARLYSVDGNPLAEIVGKMGEGFFCMSGYRIRLVTIYYETKPRLMLVLEGYEKQEQAVLDGMNMPALMDDLEFLQAFDATCSEIHDAALKAVRTCEVKTYVSFAYH